MGDGADRVLGPRTRQPTGPRCEKGQVERVFFGRHERQLDDKGRVALPAAYRKQLGDRLFLVIGANRCIDVFPAEDFEARALELAEAARRGEASDDPSSLGRSHGDRGHRRLRRAGSRSTSACARSPTSASQSKVVVTGGVDRVELWSESYLDDFSERSNAELASAGS